MKQKKRNQTSHQKNITFHTEKRARERYDIWFPNEIFFLSKEIKKFRAAGNVCLGLDRVHNSVMFLYRETVNSDKFHYLIEWRGKYYWAVWNATVEQINTFLPLDGLIDKIGRMTNSTVGYLGARNLVNLDKIKQFDVLKVNHSIIKNDFFWEHNNALDIPHHLDHNQQEQSFGDLHD